MSSPWIVGARLRTLPAAVVPVAVGTASVAADGDRIIAWRVAAALAVALAIQVGTNFANDYQDGVRGTDDGRVGPVRLVASGLASASAVRAAALASFAAAAVAGLALAAVTSWWLVVVGAVCFAAGWLYTGGPRPYGYAGLGELFVFVFFGLVATAGSAFVHAERLTATALMAAVPVGGLATALLVVNNLRDIPTDTAAGKRTLAVRMGDGPTRSLYVALVLGSLVVAALAGGSWLGAALMALVSLAAVAPARAVLRGAAGPALIPVLVATGRVQLAFGFAYSVALALS